MNDLFQKSKLVIIHDIENGIIIFDKTTNLLCNRLVKKWFRSLACCKNTFCVYQLSLSVEKPAGKQPLWAADSHQKQNLGMDQLKVRC